MTLVWECLMPDEGSLTARAIHFIANVECVTLRALEAADRISFRLFLYGLALWDIYRFIIGKH